MVLLWYHREGYGDKMLYRKKYNVIKYFAFLIFLFVMAIIILDGNKKINIVTSNVNNVKSIKSSRIYHEKESIKTVSNIKDIRKYGSTYKLSFTGTLTGYGPDCPGCGGRVYCTPNPNVQNGNIYYEDSEYGKLRILAADYSIPCGSIIKIENFSFIPGNDFYGIVMDRGSAIVGLTMDLLYPSEKDTLIIGRQRNIKFTVERWGW